MEFLDVGRVVQPKKFEDHSQSTSFNSFSINGFFSYKILFELSRRRINYLTHRLRMIQDFRVSINVIKTI